MSDDYRQTVRALALDEQTFVRLTLKGKLRGGESPWRMIVVRPVLVKGRRQLQFSYFDERRDITKNYYGPQAAERLDEALAIPFSTIHLQSTAEDVVVQVTKKGKPIFHRSAPAAQRAPDLAHNRDKELPLPADQPDPFLQTIGIMNDQGQVRPAMRDKFAQINEFLKLLEHTGELRAAEHGPLQILDCGCGSAYLTFATHHYLNAVRGIPANLVGVDLNAEVVRKSAQHGQQLGLEGVCFRTSAIIGYQPDPPPDIVLALHACDTATDEAIAQGVLSGARLIVCVPCCHHDLNRQIEPVDPFRPLLRHGILKQRMADLLTDTFRALILRIMGYRTDVIEFVSSEHTDRNLMIRAVRRAPPGEPPFAQEYADLKRFWGVTPYLETLLGERLVRG